MNDVALRVDGKIFTGWTSVSITRSLASLSGEFKLGVNVRPDTDLSALSPGRPFTLTIDDRVVITGYLDSRIRSMRATEMTITLQGRDKTGDLVDCSAIYKGSQWKNRSLEQIARDLVAPYGLKVRWELTDSASAAPFPSFTLDYSETVYEALGRAARTRGVLMTTNAAGELVFTQAAATYADRLVLGENLLDLEFKEDFRNRFSQYRVVGHGRASGKAGDTQSAAAIASQKGVITDAAVTRWRPKVFLADGKTDSQSATTRAMREQRRQIADSFRLTAKLDGWQRRDGSLWLPNVLADIDAAKFGIVTEPLLVSDVTLELNNQSGLTSELTLSPREAWLTPAESA